jgi:FtsP/CotA-like multicopper oxidase with cupredoxin domain
MQHHTETAPPDHFPTETAELPASRRPEIVELADGAALDLEISPVAKQLGDATVRMLSYNGSIPGPTLKVAQGSEVEVNGDTAGAFRWATLLLSREAVA